MDKTSASAAVGLRFYPESGQIIDLKIGISSFPAWHSAVQSRRIKSVRLFCCLKMRLLGFIRLGVVYR